MCIDFSYQLYICVSDGKSDIVDSESEKISNIFKENKKYILINIKQFN